MPKCVDCHRFDSERELCSVPMGSPIRKCVVALLEEESKTYQGKVLEIGCGGWDFTKRLSQQAGCEWHGIDPMLVDTKGRKSVATAEGIVTRIPFDDNLFDVVVGTQTLEHWHEWDSDYFEGLDEIHRVLKPGGLLSLNFPMHFHGHPMFVSGNQEAIRSLFLPSKWEWVKTEGWREEHHPLPAFKGWRTCGFDDSDIGQGSSSWIMQLHVRKKTGISTTAETENARRLLRNLPNPHFHPRYRERMIPETEKWKRQIAEHRSRYEFAAEGIQGKRVLDVGSGVGYGSKLMAERGAKEVLAIDYADEAIEWANTRFGHPSITYLMHDARLLHQLDGPFDRIVMFDVIERLDRPSEVLKSIAKLLSPGGDLYIGTPNAQKSEPLNPDGSPANPFHVREHSPEEFRKLLAENFGTVELFGQSLDPRFSAIFGSLQRMRQEALNRDLELWRNPAVRIGRLVQRILGKPAHWEAADHPVLYPTIRDWEVVHDLSEAKHVIARCTI